MDNMTEDRSLIAIAQRAAEWFVAYREGTLTAADRSEFVAWLQASPLHVREYLSVAAMAQTLGEAPALPDAELALLLRNASTESEPAKVVALHGHRPQPMPKRRWVAVAACLLVVLGALLMARWPGWRLWPDADQHYQVAGEGQGVWRLGDGSVLHLNARSSVRIRFTARERLVELERGQAMFEVSHHSPLKFRVVAGFADVVAVGTRFEVRRDAQTDQVTVVEGRVRVQSTPQSATAAFTTRAITVNAGQRLSVAADGAVSQVEKSDTRQVYAWVQHPVEFDQQPLASVVNEINHYALTPIRISDARLAQLPVSGVFNVYDAESFIAFLRRLPGVTVTSDDDRVQVASEQVL